MFSVSAILPSSAFELFSFGSVLVERVMHGKNIKENTQNIYIVNK
jgi:hypothetical protein